MFKIEFCQNKILLEICPHEGLFKVRLSSALDKEAGFSALNSHHVHLYVYFLCYELDVIEALCSASLIRDSRELYCLYNKKKHIEMA